MHIGKSGIPLEWSHNECYRIQLIKPANFPTTLTLQLTFQIWLIFQRVDIPTFQASIPTFQHSNIPVDIQTLTCKCKGYFRSASAMRFSNATTRIFNLSTSLRISSTLCSAPSFASEPDAPNASISTWASQLRDSYKPINPSVSFARICEFSKRWRKSYVLFSRFWRVC